MTTPSGVAWWKLLMCDVSAFKVNVPAGNNNNIVTFITFPTARPIHIKRQCYQLQRELIFIVAYDAIRTKL